MHLCPGASCPEECYVRCQAYVLVKPAALQCCEAFPMHIKVKVISWVALHDCQATKYTPNVG